MLRSVRWRLCWGVLVILALFCVPLARGAEPVLLEFSSLAQRLRADSPAMKANAANREALRSARTSLGDLPTVLDNQINGLSTLSGQLSQMQRSLDGSGLFSPSSPATPSMQDLALKSSLEAMLQVSQMQVNAQMMQLHNTDRGYTQGTEMSANLARLDDGDLQILMGGYKLYAGYWQAERQVIQLQAEMDLLQRKQLILEKQVELDMATRISLTELRQGSLALQQGLQLASLQRDNLMSQLNLLLGLAAESEVSLQPIAEPELEAIAAIDPETAWNTAYKNSHNLRGLRYIEVGLRDNHEDTKRQYGSGGSQALRSGKQLEAAELNIQLEAERLQVNFNTTFRKLMLSLASYQLELARQDTAAEALQLYRERYTLGNISEIEWLEQQNLFLKQTQRTDQSRDDLALAYEHWKLVLQGMAIDN